MYYLKCEINKTKFQFLCYKISIIRKFYIWSMAKWLFKEKVNCKNHVLKKGVKF